MLSKAFPLQSAEIRRRVILHFALVILCMVLSPTSPRLWARGTPPLVLTAVTPNPLTVGTITVTIQGTGYISGALVYHSNGSTITISPNGSTLSDNGGVMIAST